MNYKNTIILIIVLIAVVLGINFFFQGEKTDGPVDNPANGNELLVGGDKDEHGCLGSAGYTWCESKAECLRPFEEQWDDSCEVIPPPMNTGLDGR